MLIIILQVILALGFLMFGWMKFTSEDMVKGFDHFGLPQWFRVVTGIVEWAGALLLIAGIWLTPLATIGAALLAITMAGAILTHIRAKDPLTGSIMPLILMLLNVVVVINLI